MRVIVAEDVGLYREILIRALADYDDMRVVGEAAAVDQLFALINKGLPDIVILDIAMPRTASEDPVGDAGLSAAKDLRRSHPELPILVLSQYPNVSWAQEIAALDGPVGYQLKERVKDVNALVAAIREVAGGNTSIDQSLVQALFARKRHNDPVEKLTSTELHVLELMAEGRSNPAIATQLAYAEKTIQGLITSIYRKLGIADSKEENGKPTVNARVKAVLHFLRYGKPPPSMRGGEPPASGSP